MTKGKILIAIIFVLVAGKVCAQDEGPKYYHWSFGISAGDILNTLFNTENANKSYAAMVLEYAGQKYALQAGFRPDYNTSDTQHEGFSDKEITDQLSFSGHINLTRIIFMEQRWSLRAGLKYEGGWSKEDITKYSGFDKIISRRLQWNEGGGAVIDFRFMVHPRISLGTEASLVYTYNQTEFQKHFTNFPDFDTTTDKITGHKVEVSEPMTIYLRFHF